MLAKLKNIFGRQARGETAPQEDSLQLPIAALMLEAARMDDQVCDAERARVAALLSSHFQLDADAVARLVVRAEAEAAQSVEIYSLTRDIKNSLEESERIELIEMIWEVAYADGVLDMMEAQLMRRLAGLLYVSDRDSGHARKRVTARLGIS